MQRIAVISILVFTSVAGCDTGPRSGRGFTLPEGDVDQGKATFQRLNCHTCHTTNDIEQLMPLEGKPELTVRLGGEVSRIQTYGELVTSVINPSHRLAKRHESAGIQTEEGQSMMPIYNDVMTVTELTDIVTYLQSKYKLRPMPPTPYGPYY